MSLITIGNIQDEKHNLEKLQILGNLISWSMDWLLRWIRSPLLSTFVPKSVFFLLSPKFQARVSADPILLGSLRDRRSDSNSGSATSWSNDPRLAFSFWEGQIKNMIADWSHLSWQLQRLGALLLKGLEVPRRTTLRKEKPSFSSGISDWFVQSWVEGDFESLSAFLP